MGIEDVGSLDYWDVEQALAGQAMVQVCDQHKRVLAACACDKYAISCHRAGSL